MLKITFNVRYIFNVFDYYRTRSVATSRSRRRATFARTAICRTRSRRPPSCSSSLPSQSSAFSTDWSGWRSVARLCWPGRARTPRPAAAPMDPGLRGSSRRDASNNSAFSSCRLAPAWPSSKCSVRLLPLIAFCSTESRCFTGYRCSPYSTYFDLLQCAVQQVVWNLKTVYSLEHFLLFIKCREAAPQKNIVTQHVHK